MAHDDVLVRRGERCREMAARMDAPPQLGFQGLYGVRGVDDPPNIAGEAEEREGFPPDPAAVLGDGGIFLTLSSGLEGGERVLGGPGILGPVDVLERGRNCLSVLVRTRNPSNS